MIRWNPVILGCIFMQKNDILQTGQKWPIFQAVRGVGWCCHPSQFLVNSARKDFPLLSEISRIKIISEHSFRTDVCPGERRTIRMSDTDKLMNYILSLTPEQVDKVVSRLQELTESIAEQEQPCLREQSAQIA